MIAVLDEMLTLLQHGVEPSCRPASIVLLSLRESLATFVDTREFPFISRAQKPLPIPSLCQRRTEPAAGPVDRACSSRILRSAAAMACRASSTASALTEIEVMPKRTRCSANSGRFEGA